MFQTTDFLDSRSIIYKTSGRNVSAGWTTFQCPLPYCDDRSNHCGISPNGNSFSCFVCGSKGHIVRLIEAIDNSDRNAAYHTFMEYSDDSTYYPISASELGIKTRAVLKHPDGLDDKFLKWHLRYLKQRDYDSNIVRNKYRLKVKKWGIYIPFYLEGVEVSYTVLTWPKGPSIYNNCPVEDSVVPIKKTLYNIDSVFRTAVVVEGIFDAWRIGDGAVATMGVQFTAAQVNLLRVKKPQKVLILFDAERQAQKQANKFADAIRLFVDEVEVLELDSGDPDEMSETDILAVKSMM